MRVLWFCFCYFIWEWLVFGFRKVLLACNTIDFRGSWARFWKLYGLMPVWTLPNMRPFMTAFGTPWICWCKCMEIEKLLGGEHAGTLSKNREYGRIHKENHPHAKLSRLGCKTGLLGTTLVVSAIDLVAFVYWHPNTSWSCGTMQTIFFGGNWPSPIRPYQCRRSLSVASDQMQCRVVLPHGSFLWRWHVVHIVLTSRKKAMLFGYHALSTHLTILVHKIALIHLTTFVHFSTVVQTSWNIKRNNEHLFLLSTCRAGSQPGHIRLAKTASEAIVNVIYRHFGHTTPWAP